MGKTKNLPAGQNEAPALTPAEELDLALRQAAQRAAGSFIEFSQLALRAIRERIWERFGCQDEEEYFNRRVGVSYRSMRRWLVVATALERVPPEQIEPVKAALAELGNHKAAIVSKLIGTEHDWPAVMEFAKTATEEAVQARVSDLTGALARGASDPGERFLRMLVNAMPPNQITERVAVGEFVEGVFRAGMKHLGMTNPVAFFLLLVEQFNIELGKDGFDPKADAEA